MKTLTPTTPDALYDALNVLRSGEVDALVIHPRDPELDTVYVTLGADHKLIEECPESGATTRTTFVKLADAISSFTIRRVPATLEDWAYDINDAVRGGETLEGFIESLDWDGGQLGHRFYEENVSSHVIRTEEPAITGWFKEALAKAEDRL